MIRNHLLFADNAAPVVFAPCANDLQVLIQSRIFSSASLNSKLLLFMSVPQIIITAYSVPIYTYITLWVWVITRAMLCIARSLPSCGVRPSVRPSYAGIVSKRLKLPENFFDHLVAPSF